MKKTYLKPCLEVVDFSAQHVQLLAGSVQGGDVLIDEPAGTDVPGLAPVLLPGMNLPGLDL